MHQGHSRYPKHPHLFGRGSDTGILKDSGKAELVDMIHRRLGAHPGTKSTRSCGN